MDCCTDVGCMLIALRLMLTIIEVDDVYIGYLVFGLSSGNDTSRHLGKNHPGI